MLRAIASAICAAALAACQTVPDKVVATEQPQRQDFAISGVLDTAFDGIGTKGIEVWINETVATISHDGTFSANVPIAPYYRVIAKGKGIYSAIQTFGIRELYRDGCDCLRLPTIDVVARKPGRVGLFFAGDAMAGRRYVEPIWGERQLVDPADPLPDMRQLLEPMTPYIESADFASVNLEIVLSETEFENSPPKSVVFYAHPALAQALKEAGFDYVSLGNNHSYDYLEEGLKTTIDAVEAAGLAWSGAGHDEEQALKASRLRVAGQDLCLLGYVGWKGRVEPNQVAEAGKGGAAYGNDVNIATSVEREAATGCAVIAQYHGSREYSEGPTEESERRMKLAIEKGAALIASHHPHVAHGVELHDGSLIAYSLGNFLFDQYFLETHGSLVLRAWLDDGKFVRGEIVPLRVLDYRPVPAVGSMREAILERISKLSAERGTTITRNGGHGVIVPDKNRQQSRSAGSESCQSGKDLLRAGDFENAVFKDAVDRSLKATGGRIEYEFEDTSGHFLRITPHEGSQTFSLATSTFFRVIPSNRIVVSGRILTGQGVKLSLLSQNRTDGMGRFEALETAPFDDRGSKVIAGSNVWQEFEFAFELDEQSPVRPFRPILQITNQDIVGGPVASVKMDDLKVVAITAQDCS